MTRLPSLIAALSLLALAAAPPAPTDDDPEPAVTDPFDGKLRLKWGVVRPDETHYSLTKNKGKLTLTTQRGSFHGGTGKDGGAPKNLFLLRNAFGRDADFTVSVCVNVFDPSAHYQQAGLLLYDDDDNYLKFTCEFNATKPQKIILVMMRESESKPEHKTADAPADAKKVWLRITRRKTTYEYASSPDGKEWTAHHEWEWGSKAPAKFGFLAKNGGTDAGEIDVCFEDFRARRASRSKKSD